MKVRLIPRTIAALVLAAAAGVLGAGVSSAATTAPTAREPFQSVGDSYPVDSGKTGPLKPLHNTGDIHPMCGSGYHVRGKYTSDGHGSDADFYPEVKVHGDSIAVVPFSTRGSEPNGKTPNGYNTYQGFHINLYNSSLTNKHEGYFSWVCDSN
ncbi:hypothetical protein ACFZAV_39850 [Streptomyces sp. NPDC008343]|uniref:hypothetical protein n=1 Tax=Streptomyces sp. NPDC008343 TaxID=3364828 RepID=UPI0036EF5B0C